VIEIPSNRRVIDLKAVLRELAGLGIMSVLVEGGRQIHTSLLVRDLVDKVVAFISPKIIGGAQLRAPVEDLGLTGIEQALELRDVQFQTIDGDICFEGYLHDI
jgi:diaminohydroxyphosphoribosylaminopyrimidine deaminase/5-amino-6-(5-phosphoribosylamino)uracil reductase